MSDESKIIPHIREIAIAWRRDRLKSDRERVTSQLEAYEGQIVWLFEGIYDAGHEDGYAQGVIEEAARNRNKTIVSPNLTPDELMQLSGLLERAFPVV